MAGLSLPPSHRQKTQMDHQQQTPLHSHAKPEERATAAAGLSTAGLVDGAGAQQPLMTSSRRPPLAEGCMVFTASWRGQESPQQRAGALWSRLEKACPQDGCIFCS